MKKKKSVHKDKRVRMFEGLPVVDGTKDIDISITPADVRNSKKKNPGECAAAVAGKRELHREVKVYMSRIYVKDTKKKRWERYVTPGNMSTEIVSFDRGSEFTPGEYAFKAPTTGQRLGADRRNRDKNRKSGNKRRKYHITANVRVSAKEGWKRN